MFSFASTIRLSFLICVLIINACATETAGTSPKIIYSQDLLPNNVFTRGIEGPAVDKNGNLFAVNFQQEGTIGQISFGQSSYGKSTYEETASQKNGQAAARLYATLPDGSVGNGIRFDQEGVMYVADYAGHNILKKVSRDAPFVMHTHSNAMHQPNDIAIMDNGILFASDPDWQNKSGQLWRITPGGENFLLEKNMGTTNGIEVSPDNALLYVNESIQRKIWVYDINSDGEIRNKRLFHQFEDHGLDGMRCDTLGNLYVARYDAGQVVVLSPQGDLLYSVTLKGKKPTNVAFGGSDGQTVFVTMQGRGTIEYFTAEHPGRAFILLRENHNE